MICKYMGLQVTDKYYGLVHEMVIISVNNTTIMRDIQVITDQKILANKPDKVLHNKKEKTCLLNDIALPDNKTLTQKKLKN
jgi:hypothetical protein